MAEYGKDLTLAIGDGGGPEVFTVLATIRGAEFGQTNEAIDSSDQAAANTGDRTYLAGVLRERGFSGDGVIDAADAPQLQTAFDLPETSTQNWQVAVPGVGTFEGAFSVTTLNWTGPYEDVATFSIEMRALGALAFTAVT